MNPSDRLLQQVRRARSGGRLVRALNDYIATVDPKAQRYVDSYPGALACRAGCGSCCSLRVHVYAHDAFVLADHIRARFTPAQQAALVLGLRERVRRISAMTEEEHRRAKLPCPMLVEERCSVHPGRPFACRSFTSLDAKVCQRSFDYPIEQAPPRPFDRGMNALWQEIKGWAHGVFQAAGYDTTVYELCSALLEALTRPAAERRWRNRKKAFPGVTLAWPCDSSVAAENARKILAARSGRRRPRPLSAGVRARPARARPRAAKGCVDQ